MCEGSNASWSLLYSVLLSNLGLRDASASKKAAPQRTQNQVDGWMDWVLLRKLGLPEHLACGANKVLCIINRSKSSYNYGIIICCHIVTIVFIGNDDEYCKCEYWAIIRSYHHYHIVSYCHIIIIILSHIVISSSYCHHSFYGWWITTGNGEYWAIMRLYHHIVS